MNEILVSIAPVLLGEGVRLFDAPLLELGRLADAVASDSA